MTKKIPLPEHENIENFVQFLLDEERESFTFEEAESVADATETCPTYVIRELKSYGLAMIPRSEPKKVRGFTTSSHDRWYGPGAAKTHGGSGNEQISKFGGREG